MAVTLYDSGLTITDDQAARLDTYSVAVWLPRYVDEIGSEPPGWPDAAAHELLAEWAIVKVITEVVLRWERREARRAITVDPW